MPDVADVVYSKIVCDAEGKTGSVSGDTDYSPAYGKYVKADDHGYQFYVQMPSGGSSNKTAVNMVVPMGGPQAGLFRFPRVGEQVLICKLDGVDSYYLLGFVPTAKAPFYPEGAEANSNVVDGYNPGQQNPGAMADFLDDKGMALRYKRDDGKAGERDFSEIGFYNKKAKWPDAVKKNAEMGTRLPEDRFSRIDVLNIQSAGDIETRAENYHLLKAKRVEFLAGTGEISPEKRADNCRDNYAHWDRADAPLGDNPLDDPAVHGGDAHFRGGKLILKAAGEIRIQVGRTTLLIDDKGFSVLTRKVNSNVPLPNDTSFSMNSRDGISMFGESVNIASARKFSVSDGWGAGVESITGRLDISGWQINQKTYDKLQQKWALAFNTIVFARNLVLGGMATDPKANYAATMVNLSLDIAKWLLEQIKGFQALAKSFENYKKNAETLRDRRIDIAVALTNELNQQHQAGRISDAVFPDFFRNLDLQFGSGSLEATDNVLDTASMLVGAEPVEMLMAALNLVLDIAAEVYAVVEQSAAIIWRKDLSGAIFEGANKKWNAQGKSDFRDTLNLVAMSIDNGLIALAMTGAFGFVGTGGPASIRLRQTGDVLIKAGEQKNLYAELGQKAAIPASIFTEKSMKWIKGGLALGRVTSLAGNFANLVLRLEAMQNKIPVYVEKL